jgi:protein-disulfide isomerase
MKQQKKSSILPFVIIGVVLIAVVGVILIGMGVIGAGWWAYSSSTKRPAQSTATNARPGQNPATNPNAPVGAPLGVNMLGSATAPVTLEEFADFQCGACAATHPTVKEIQSAYAGNKNFRFVFRHYPLPIPAHDKAYNASVANEAAGLQGKFWQMQEMLFRNQSAWSQNPNYMQLWEQYAASIGMDVERFKTDMAGTVTKQRVDADLARARGLGVNSTPTMYLNGEPIPLAEMNTTGLRRAIDAAIQRASSGPQSAPAPANAR